MQHREHSQAYIEAIYAQWHNEDRAAAAVQSASIALGRENYLSTVDGARERLTRMAALAWKVALCRHILASDDVPTFLIGNQRAELDAAVRELQVEYNQLCLELTQSFINHQGELDAAINQLTVEHRVLDHQQAVAEVQNANHDEDHDVANGIMLGFQQVLDANDQAHQQQLATINDFGTERLMLGDFLRSMNEVLRPQLPNREEIVEFFNRVNAQANRQNNNNNQDNYNDDNAGEPNERDGALNPQNPDDVLQQIIQEDVRLLETNIENRLNGLNEQQQDYQNVNEELIRRLRAQRERMRSSLEEMRARFRENREADALHQRQIEEDQQSREREHQRHMDQQVQQAIEAMRQAANGNMGNSGNNSGNINAGNVNPAPVPVLHQQQGNSSQQNNRGGRNGGKSGKSGSNIWITLGIVLLSLLVTAGVIVGVIFGIKHLQSPSSKNRV